MHEKHVCPTCRREFRSVLDYPRVRVVGVEELPIPEAVDRHSEAAARKRLARRAEAGSLEEQLKRLGDGINITPAIAAACRTAAVRAFLQQFAALSGREVESSRLLPPLKRDAIFRRCYPIPGTDLYLSLDEGEPSASGSRTAEVQILCEGPNMGSAGGPTLEPLAPIARLEYAGELEGQDAPGAHPPFVSPPKATSS